MVIFYRVKNEFNQYLIVKNETQLNAKYRLQKNDFTYWNSIEEALSNKNVAEQKSKIEGLIIEKVSLQVISSWKYPAIDDSYKYGNDVFTIRNSKGEYFSLNGLITDDIIKAKYYTSVSKLKTAMRRLINPKAMLLRCEADGKFHQVEKVTESAFDNFEIVQIRLTNERKEN